MDKSKLSQLREADKKFFLHPFTNHSAMHENGTYVITSGQGCWLQDEQNRKLLDGLAGLWCVNVGYGCKEIVKAAHEQLEKLAFYPSFFNTTTEPTILLAEKIANLLPKNLKHIMFCNSGSEANESALKIIRGYNKLKGRSEKNKIIARTWSYHGVGIASTSLTGLPTCQTPFDLPLPGFLHVPGPYAYEYGKSEAEVSKWALEETEKLILKEGANTIAAMFVEPVQGAGGVIVPPTGYLKSLRDLCRKHDILFVADEVITGFGRLGDWFASNLWNLEPDIVTMAKGLTSGYVPLGATALSDEITDTLNKGGYLAHGFTYSGHPVATAAALANIAVIERDKLCEKVRDHTAPYFLKQLHSLASHPAVGEVRGTGLIGAIEVLPRGGKKDLSPTLNLGLKMFELVRKENIIARGIRNLVAVAPPLIISDAEIDTLIGGIKRGLDKLWD